MYDTTSMPVNGVRDPNLLASTNEQWHDQQRKLINSAFSLTQLLRYEPWVDDTIILFLQEMRDRFVDRDGPEGIIQLPVWLGYFAADVISEMTFGEKTGFLEKGEDVQGIISSVRMVFGPWLYVRPLAFNTRRLCVELFC